MVQVKAPSKNSLCKVKIEDGIITVFTPEGERITGVLEAKAAQDVDTAHRKSAIVTLTMICRTE